MAGMGLVHLAEVLDLQVTGDAAITSIEFDSRQVEPGSLFCCLPGQDSDGHQFASEALARGAKALLCERPMGLGVVELLVPEGQCRPAMARLAAAFWGHPSESMLVIGVTGTNGKTTVSHMLASILEAGGYRTGVVGTLESKRTTPESPVLQATLARFLADGLTAAVLEVSSHGLAQHRVDEVDFDVSVFTNLSQDHLDFHGDMEQYFAAKASLFTPEHSVRAVVNSDDAWGRRLIEAQSIPTVAFSDASVSEVCIGPAGSTFTWRGRPVALGLGGSFNVQNAIAAACAASLVGVSDEAVATGLSQLESVPGRVEAVRRGQDFVVLVDYAHTPDGLEQLLVSARQTSGPRARVIVVFGCGGDRDRSKRPRMGRVATDLADLAVLTTDNPRHEDPRAIVAEVLAGVVRTDVLVIEPDRRAAIDLAVSAARPGDVVLVTGKGHEQFQIVGDHALPFEDRAEAWSALERVQGAGS